MPDSNINGSRQIANYFRYIFRSETSGEKATPTSSFNLFVSNIKFIFFPRPLYRPTIRRMMHSCVGTGGLRSGRPLPGFISLQNAISKEYWFYQPPASFHSLASVCVMVKSTTWWKARTLPRPNRFQAPSFGPVEHFPGFSLEMRMYSRSCAHTQHIPFYTWATPPPLPTPAVVSCSAAPPRANTGKQPSARGPSPRPDIFCDILIPAHENLPGPTYR